MSVSLFGSGGRPCGYDFVDAGGDDGTKNESDSTPQRLDDIDIPLGELGGADQVTKGVLIYLLFMYPEREEYIRRRVYQLWEMEGRPLVEVQTVVENEINGMLERIKDERADRMERLENPGTREEAVLTGFDVRVAAAMDKRDGAKAVLDKATARANAARAGADAAEEASMSWFQKKKLRVQRWLDGAGK
ncbi:MAG: DUF2934 domain-containing protein [Puniceicoccales bacterium]|jgi:hypothetical protein|nr:DUF2934 domain-containing protein [Puniceicoccales bacterium]